MGLFEQGHVARGYAHCRPRFHAEVISRIGETLGLRGRMPRALDVGCGTGLSTSPLTRLAQTAIGVDRARQMVSAAAPEAGVSYLVSAAEQLPFAEATFGAVTVSGAINWIDRHRFLPEAHRVLAESGWLLVYDGAEMGAMVGSEDFGDWYRGEYLQRLPRPARDESQIGEAEAAGGGFTLADTQDYVLELPFTLPTYVGFLLTQSNTTAAVAQRGETTEAIRCWLTESLQSLFQGEEKKMLFGGYIWYLQRTT